MFCGKCGNEMQEGEMFCGKCGIKVNIENNSTLENSKKIKSKKRKFIIGIIISIFIIAICISVIVFFNQGKVKEYIDNINGVQEKKKTTLYDIQSIKPIEGNNTTLVESIGLAALIEEWPEEDKILINTAGIEMVGYIINEELIGVYIHFSRPQYINKGYENYGIKPQLSGYCIESKYGVVKVNDVDVFLQDNRGTMRELIDKKVVEVSRGTWYHEETFTPAGLSQSVSSIVAEGAYESVLKKTQDIKNEITNMAIKKGWIEGKIIDKNEELANMENFLEAIYIKYPKAKNQIHTDGEKYWILGNQNNKLYFTDFNSFEKALMERQLGQYSNSNTDENDNKEENTNNNQYDSNNDNSDNNEEKYEDTAITFSYDELENKTEEELVKLFKEKGLVPKVNKTTIEVPYVDKRANTTVITNFGGYSFEKGESVEIKATYYKPKEWKTYVKVDTSKDGKTFNVKGKTCHTTQIYPNYDVDVTYSFYENPVGLSSYEINQIGRGVEIYINGKLEGKGSSLWKEYTFDKIETITIKIVAPYVYEYSLEGLDERGEGTMIDKNVTLYEKKINLKELYSGEGEMVEIEL